MDCEFLCRRVGVSPPLPSSVENRWGAAGDRRRRRPGVWGPFVIFFSVGSRLPSSSSSSSPAFLDWPPPSGPRLCFSLGRTFGGGEGRSSLPISWRESDSLHFPFFPPRPLPLLPPSKARIALCAPAPGLSCAPPCAPGSAENEIRGLESRFKNEHV